MQKTNIFSSLSLKKIEKQLILAGENKYSPNSFLTLRILSTIVIFFAGLFLLDNGHILGFICAFLWYNLFDIILKVKIKTRAEILETDALDFFEILTLTLESGRNLEGALEATVSNVDSSLSDEFKRTLFEIKFGKPVINAFSDMRDRIPSDIVNNIILSIVEASNFGNDVLDTMYNQIEYLRDKKVLSVRERINKIPNRISIVSVIFIVPIILILILGPYLIELIG